MVDPSFIIIITIIFLFFSFSIFSGYAHYQQQHQEFIKKLFSLDLMIHRNSSFKKNNSKNICSETTTLVTFKSKVQEIINHLKNQVLFEMVL